MILGPLEELLITAADVFMTIEERGEEARSGSLLRDDDELILGFP